jgi:hypothetical protein
MRETKVGILTFSDGREYIHRDLEPLNRRYQDGLARALEATGEVRWSRDARSSATRRPPSRRDAAWPRPAAT